MLIHILIILFLNPQHLQTAKPNLLLIKPALLQMLYELRVIPLESCQQILNELIPAVLKLLQFFNAAKQCISLIHTYLKLNRTLNITDNGLNSYAYA